ncbi:hypothetical protein HB816_13785 [Listeria booriae]|uniref:hypothetical protein n=1 Tax=Listeria booriae TaxID=1552123 RepID=UPI0016260A87|nr:hypothetical protein [Listeria booriae]MBC1231521.1 hypothetical protein [Listeria booriae]
MTRLLERRKTILPSNKKRQLEILREIVILQKNRNCEKSVKKLQIELEKLMSERDQFKRSLLASEIIFEITLGAPFDDLEIVHFQRMKDNRLTLKDIADYYEITKNALDGRLNKMGLYENRRKQP